MFKIALPILGVTSSLVAEKFYCEQLGFRRAYAYRPNPQKLDPCWLGVIRDGAHIVLSSFAGDGPPGTRNVQLLVDDVAALQQELTKAGVDCGGEIQDQSWGHLEFNTVDPDGNRLNFAQEKNG